jgi:hemerythrin-like domain-containing protein
MAKSAPEVEDIPAALLADPLDWFFAEHYRHRQACSLMEHVAQAAVFDETAIRRLIRFIQDDLPLHLIDEDEDLFPLLRHRALAEDDIERILGLLCADHKQDRQQAKLLADLLRAALQTGQAPSADPRAQEALSAFATHERRHLALENAIVLPIARQRLSADDLAGLGQRLGARRGLDLTGEPR